MPGSVDNVVVATVMPWNLCKRFQRARTRAILENSYCDGTNQRVNLTGSSRKRWSIEMRLVPAELAELRTFYEARKGPQEAFLFYDVWEFTPHFDYDETGAAEGVGRYPVRFENAWGQSVDWVRGGIGLELVEVN